MRQVVLKRRPVGLPSTEDFEIRQADAPVTAPEGCLLAQTLFVSVDPAMRGWIGAGANYADPVPLGAVMRALGVARVVRSDLEPWREGDLVFGWTGWSGACVMAPAQILWRVDPKLAPPHAWLSVLGLNGLTAVKGFDRALARSGETLLVTTAAGGVGSLVGQLGRRAGMRVIGLTGHPAKARLARERFGYDTVIDYRASPDLGAVLGEACPDGIDVFWDNVGGHIADVVFDHLAVGARVLQCGTMGLAADGAPTGPRRERVMIVKRLTWSGFIAMDGDFEADQGVLSRLIELVGEGALANEDEIVDGLSQAPSALVRLFAGENLGRVCVRLSPDDHTGEVL